MPDISAETITDIFKKVVIDSYGIGPDALNDDGELDGCFPDGTYNEHLASATDAFVGEIEVAGGIEGWDSAEVDGYEEKAVKIKAAIDAALANEDWLQQQVGDLVDLFRACTIYARSRLELE